MTLEIRKLLVCSTNHISDATAAMLDDTPAKDWPVRGGPYSSFGWMIYAHEENADGKIPLDLFAVLKFARDKGCDNVLFDCDADVLAGFPIYGEDSDEDAPQSGARPLWSSKPSKRIVGNAIDMGGGNFAAQYAIPGMIPDLIRHRDHEPEIYASAEAAEFAAMRAAINTFNQPREHASKGRRRIGAVRPAKITGAEFAASLHVAGLDVEDFAYIADKPVNRVIAWSDGTQDIPHEVHVLLAIFEAFDAAVDVALETTEAAITRAEGER